MNKIVIGNKNNPLYHTIHTADKIKNVKIIEFVFPDLNDKRGNFTKWMGLTIKKQTNDNKIMAVLGSP